MFVVLHICLFLFTGLRQVVPEAARDRVVIVQRGVAPIGLFLAWDGNLQGWDFGF